VTVDRSLQYSKLAFDVLSPKGYKMINAFDVTAAFAYDTDGQVSCMVLSRYPIVITQTFCSLSKRHSNLGRWRAYCWPANPNHHHKVLPSFVQ